MLQNTDFMPAIFESGNKFKQISKKYNNHDTEILNKVKKIFYSDENVNNIQKMLKKNVYDKSNKKYIIKPQNKQDLFITMREFFNYSTIDYDRDISNQVYDLNKKIVDAITPDIILEIGLYKKKMNDLYHTPDPLEYPLNDSKKGNNPLPSWMSNFY